MTSEVVTNALLHGSGMVIVDALASDWGVTSYPPGKIVWFEVLVHP